MKIAISTSVGGLCDRVCPMFGRCATFTLVEADEKTQKIVKTVVVPNPGNQTGGGAGIIAAQSLIDNEANSVITGNCGPNALDVLMQARVRVFSSAGLVEESVNSLLRGKLPEISTPVAPHFGMNRRSQSGRKWGLRGGRK
ncbi:MAG: NifB/NifX family molybdenum-iron cluster-binding protein [Candidatus Micrarchaeota archaeon]